MKQESQFALEQASWPAFLADEAGTIRRANEAAQGTFGPVVDGSASLLSSIWGAENEENAGQFLAKLGRVASSEVRVNLRLKGGGQAAFAAHVCAFPGEGQKLFLFQLFPPEPTPARKDPPSSAPPHPGLGAEQANQAQKQKLECALQLARTVALDFNNALTIVLGHVSLILSKADPEHPWRNALMEVEKSAERAAEIASDLAAFSRQEKDARTQIAGDINDVLRRTAEIFQSSAGPGITWSLKLESRLNLVVCDEAKIQQALVKVLDNAVQALAGQGTVRLETANRELTTPLTDGSITIAPGNYVCVTVADSGPGIQPQVMPRIFEPFFTTKPSHRGLGLAWVYGIVTNHGGSVAVTSEVGRGTSVRVYLPAQKRVVRETVSKPEELRGNQTILMVDDEDLMLTMGQTVLSAFGYRVLTANSGQRALEIFSAGSPRVDLVITDMVMPQMSGRELVELLRMRDPAVRILCTSGYVRPTASDTLLYLQKPFTSQELVRKVRQALGKVD
jgi:signal transduction histidine kinase/CheY-like chemotaxis protein